MLATTIVVTALLLGVIGLQAERRGRAIELWICNAVTAALLVATASAHAAGRVG